MTQIEAFLRDYPNWALAHLRISEILRDFRRFGEARKSILTARSILGRPHPFVTYSLGRVYLSAGRHALAQRYFVEALQLDPDDELAALDLARSLRYQGRFNEAEHCLIKLDDHPEAAYQRGLLARCRENWRESRRWFDLAGAQMEIADLDAANRGEYHPDRLVCQLLWGRKQCSEDPISPQGHYYQAFALAGLHRIPEALAQAKAWQRKAKHPRMGQVLQASVLKAGHCYQRASHIYAKLTPSAKSTSTWILAGSCLARLGKLAQAEHCHRQALHHPGDHDEAALNLALVLRAQGHYREALQWANRSEELGCEPHHLQDLQADLGGVVHPG